MKKMIISIVACLFICGLTVAEAEERYIVKLSDELTEVELMNEFGEVPSLASRGIVVVNEKTELQEYIDKGYVEYAEPDYDVELFSSGYTDELYDGQWYHSKIKSTYAWDLATCGNEVKIAVIDSGCNEHLDIIDNLKSGYDFINSSTKTTDSIGHGTHVSGIIASSMNGEGIIGIANKSSIIPLKCFDNGASSKVSVISSAIYDAVDKYDCRIINMSWGVNADSETLRNAINYANSKGVLLVAAVGNKGSDILYYPAAYDCVIGVGAVDKDLNICNFSQYNKSVYVVAPGKNILSLGKSNDNYVTMSGTSQAAPMVSSLLSMMLNIDGNLTNERAKEILKISCDDLGNTGYDVYYGYGLINVQKVFDAMLKTKRYYISPIYVDNGFANISVYNNTSEPLNCDLIMGLYNKNVFGMINVIPICLNGQQSSNYVLGDVGEYKTVKCFMWSSINLLMPLLEYRECFITN